MNSIKKIILITVFVFLSKMAWSIENISIDGLISDQVITRVGQLFYDYLIGGWQPPAFAGNIVVKERPDNLSANLIWVEVNDQVVYESRVGFVPSLIEEKALEARQNIEKYILDNNESLHGLEDVK